MKIIINKCYGGFSISDEALNMLVKLGSKEAKKYKKEVKGGSFLLTNANFIYGMERNNPLLVKVVEKLGTKEASGDLAELKVVEIPDGVEWEIDEYDGVESIHEVHRSWG